MDEGKTNVLFFQDLASWRGGSLLKKALSIFLVFLFLINSASVYGQISSFGQPSSTQKFGIQNFLQSGANPSPKGATQSPVTTQKSVGEGGEYQVHVLGQVVSPGIYQIGPSVRVADAISTAGGINQSGSVRHIQLREGQGKIRQIDLFKYTQNGDLGANPFVQENDVIFVPYLENTVRIEGPVRKTGVYELSNEKTVEDVIKLAGGYTVGVSEKGEVVIIRYEDEKRQLVKVANLSTELEKQPVQAGDVIVIPHIFTKNKKFDYNIAELPSDNIFYPSSKSTIFVVGSVSNGGAYPYNPNLSIQDYINMAGPNQLAKVSGARIMMSDGRINHSIKKYTLSPGDSIIVPEKKATVSNVLSWYSTLTSTLFSVIALRSLSQSF